MSSVYAPFLAFLSLSLLSLGCQQDDPVWELPCEQRPAREVIPGTGEGSFEEPDEPVEIQYGSQGGSHIWFAVRMRGFGPTATVSYGIADPEDTNVSYSGPWQELVDLKYNSGEEASETAGLFAFLGGYDEETGVSTPGPSSGAKILFWAEVTDQCTSEPVRGETEAEVE